MSNVCCDRMGMGEAGKKAKRKGPRHGRNQAVGRRVRRKLRQDVQDKQDGFAIQDPSFKGAALMGMLILLVYPVNPVHPVRIQGLVKNSTCLCSPPSAFNPACISLAFRLVGTRTPGLRAQGKSGQIKPCQTG